MDSLVPPVSGLSWCCALLAGSFDPIWQEMSSHLEKMRVNASSTSFGLSAISGEIST
jgi:hypothetical protein